LAIGKPAEAWRILEMSCPNVVDRISCLQAKIKVGTILKVPSQELDGLMKQIATLGCVDTVSCSQIYLWIGEFYLQQGSVGAAAKAYERAVQEDPENTNLWLRLGDLSYQLGATSRAVNAWEQASRRLPNDTVLRERIQTEKQKLIGTLHGF
jgi:tetratricopeptide (TPR) repeat protein